MICCEHKSPRRRRVTCDRPAMCMLRLGCATKNDHTPHHPSEFWSYLGYTGTTRTWRSRWWYRQEKILKPETLPEPESEVTTVCNFLQWLVLSGTTGATPLPTPNPTRTPTVALSIALSGVTCDDYDQSAFFAALRVPPGGAAFDDVELHRRRLHRSGEDAPSLRVTSSR